MPISYGIIASQVSGHLVTDAGAMFPLGSYTVPSGGAASVTFDLTGITGYTHLQLRGILRSTASGTGSTGLLVKYNSDTGNNYTIHALEGNGTNTSAAGYASQGYGDAIEMPKGGETASVYGGFVCDIFNYANTNKYKTFRSLAGYDSNGSGKVGLYSSVWMSTSAITRIDLTVGTGFTQYSSVALFGVKA